MKDKISPKYIGNLFAFRVAYYLDLAYNNGKKGLGGK